jgi:dTDP-4-amino-4,6-dideoxygalactose transaminase
MLDLKAEYEYLKPQIDRALQTCLTHQRWILGPEVQELEAEIAQYLGVRHCIGVSSGTEALVLSLRALAIKTTGDEYFARTGEIITTPFTFTATGDAILRSGATPVFVDIDAATCNIDCGKIREYLSSPAGAAVVGVVPVHLYGQACDMDELTVLAEEFGLFMVEDAAQAFGGAWKNGKLGSFGACGAFSFFPSKNLGGFGDGGMVSTNDDETAELIRMLLKHGGRDKYNVDHIGYNARLDTLQAAVLLAKLRFIDEFNERRRKIASRYDDGLAGTSGLILPDEREGAYHVFNQYTVRSGRRDRLSRHLQEEGISTMVYYPYPLHKMTVFRGARAKVHGELPYAETACREVLSLPIEPLMEEQDVARVIHSVRKGMVIPER